MLWIPRGTSKFGGVTLTCPAILLHQIYQDGASCVIYLTVGLRHTFVAFVAIARSAADDV